MSIMKPSKSPKPPKTPKRKNNKSRPFSKTELQEDLIIEGRAIGLAPAYAEQVATKVATNVEKWASSHGDITEEDIERVTTKELENLHKDLAYIHKHRRRII